MIDTSVKTMRLSLLLLTAFIGVKGSLDAAQQNTTDNATAVAGLSASSPQLAFDVVSIRPSKSGTQPGISVYGDEFRSNNEPVLSILLWAYYPVELQTEDRVSKAPAWVKSDGYDIEAKLDDASAKVWLHMNGWQRRESVRPMLQKLLADRFKLVAHQIPAEVQGYALFLGKSGPNLKAAKTDEIIPSDALIIPGGGRMTPIQSTAKPVLTFYDASITSMAAELSNIFRTPVQDRTGLAGKYDFELTRWQNQDGSYTFDFEALGLTLKPAKVPATTLVVDNVERPSEN